MPKIIILQKVHSKKILLKTLKVWLHLFKTHLNPGFDHISDAGSSGVHKVAVKTFCAHAYYQYCRYSLTDWAIWGCRIQRLARQIQTFELKNNLQINSMTVYHVYGVYLSLLLLYFYKIFYLSGHEWSSH